MTRCGALHCRAALEHLHFFKVEMPNFNDLPTVRPAHAHRLFQKQPEQQPALQAAPTQTQARYMRQWSDAWRALPPTSQRSNKNLVVLCQNTVNVLGGRGGGDPFAKGALPPKTLQRGTLPVQTLIL